MRGFLYHINELNMIIDIFLPLSLVFIMFTLGIGLTYSDFTNVFRQPKAFTIGLFNPDYFTALNCILYYIDFWVKSRNGSWFYDFSILS